eukprot:g15342.t1
MNTLSGHVTISKAAILVVIQELGAGCGLASLLAARLGGDVLATDFRQLPLQLLRAAARRQALRIRTAQLDISELSVPLPPAELVVASDVLYEKGTADGMAHRVAEAVRRGSAVLVADVGRPNRKAFMTQLRDLLPEVEIGSDFTTEGMAIQETDGPPSPSREVPVGRDPRSSYESFVGRYIDKVCACLQAKAGENDWSFSDSEGSVAFPLPNVSIFDVPTWTSVTDFQAWQGRKGTPELPNFKYYSSQLSRLLHALCKRSSSDAAT